MTVAIHDLDAYIEASRPGFEADLRTIVEIPTISMDPARQPDIRLGADWAVAFLQRMGAEARIIETAGHPLVVGIWRHPDAKRTLTVYNHMDVQPASEPGWTTEPFAFINDNGTYRGRGTTDDKGPALTAVYALRYAHEQGVPLTLRILWEFEEEIGSPNFAEALATHRDALATDSVLVSDTIWINRQKPAAPLGLRGMVTFRLLLETGTKDVHSGLVGGAARNPLAEMAEVIAAMLDARTGDIRIPGIYDEVAPLSAEEQAGFVAAGFDPAEFQRVYGLKGLRHQDVAEVTRRIWAWPTLEVHGIVGGYSGPGVKSVVPPTAEAKLSMRLVPDQQPDVIIERVRAFVAHLNPDIRLEVGGKLEPYKGSATGPYATALRQAIAFGFGSEPAFVREGGSIGAVVSMQRYLGCPVMFLGLSLPEHGYHAPNENFDWGMASGGMKAFVRYCEAVSTLEA
ncbi:MAG: M20/M25/M40 family metallo-hydrolase [Candidatus Sericytochromatia bacterium]|nr:M20/M25/M40 family metallo-hydrolase [Candidatus Sericytochromatia bacterium]